MFLSPGFHWQRGWQKFFSWDLHFFFIFCLLCTLRIPYGSATFTRVTDLCAMPPLGDALSEARVCLSIFLIVQYPLLIHPRAQTMRQELLGDGWIKAKSSFLWSLPSEDMDMIWVMGKLAVTDKHTSGGNIGDLLHSKKGDVIELLKIVMLSWDQRVKSLVEAKVFPVEATA